ncbi:MAG: hypothetical protein GWP91_02160 [Rhodobacterales bacterium]|nr:hypothetical protein [Rhodobacterales bacterium]
MRLVALLLLGACSASSTVDGKVIDIWGEPIAGATVLMDGVTERPSTNAEGAYSFPSKEGPQKLKAGKEGYIQAEAEVEVATEGNTEGPLFRLYQKPAEAGFFLVGPSEYHKLEPQMVHTVGNFDPTRGLKSVGDLKTDRESLEIVFHTELKYEEILRLDLELHKLTFVQQKKMDGALGEQEVSVNLYTSDVEIPIEINKTVSRTDYTITPSTKLEPGFYAFQTQELLDTQDQEIFDRIPESLRVVFPLEYK